MKVCFPVFLAFIALFATPLAAHEYSAGPLNIDHPWSRPTPPGVPMAAGYMTITNNGDSAVTLLGASTPRAQAVSIHQNRMHMEMLSMEPLPEGLVIGAGETVKLQPRGYHLMLEKIDRPLEEGQRVPLTLRFEGAPEIDVELAVQPLAEEGSGPDTGDDSADKHGSHQH